MHKVRAPLSNLLKNKKWKWSENYQKVSDKIFFKILIPNFSLAHFDPPVEMGVISDTSKYGIGAVVILKYKGGGSCLMFSDISRKKYIQIKKESLVIIFAIKLSATVSSRY